MDIDTIDRECLLSSNEQTSIVFDNQLVELDDLVDYDEFDDLDDFETHSVNDEDSGALDDSFIPKVGMLFSSPEEALAFYNRYALKMGFGTRKSSTSVSKTEKSKIVGRKFVCDKEGKRKRYCEKSIDIHASYFRETRVGCKAMMWIRLNELGTWNVSNFIAQHNNHELSTPSKAAKHRSHKRIHRQEAVKNLITQFHDTGLPNASIAKAVKCKHFEKVGLLCKHALCILWKKQILKIPDRYILKRWTIEARYQSVEIRFENDIFDSEVDRELLWGLRYNMNKVLEEAFKSQAFAKEMNDIITKKLAEVSLRAQDSLVEPPISSKYLSNTNPVIVIRDPTGVAKTKGRPRQASRIQSSLEISQEDESKKRTCGFGKEKGHYRTGCPKAKEMERRVMEQKRQ